MSSFWDWVDRRAVVRRVMTLGTFAMTMVTIWWAMRFAMESPRSGADVAMIIGAVMVPVNGLQGYIFGAYVKGRTDV